MFQIKSFLLDCTSGPGFGEYYKVLDCLLLEVAFQVILAYLLLILKSEKKLDILKDTLLMEYINLIQMLT